MNGPILIVEDDQDIMLTIRLTLEMNGFEVAGASDAEESLESLDKQMPAAMILDIRLPGMDGWQLLETMRARGVFPVLPVIIVSAHADESAAKRAIELGCRGYLVKPFSSAELLTALQQAGAGS